MKTTLTLLAALLAAPAVAQVSEVCPATGQPLDGPATLTEVDGTLICVEDAPMLGLRSQVISAGEQHEPVQSAECLPRWRLPAVYPEASVTAAERAALRSSGPWRLDAPPSSLASEYQTAEELRLALWPLPDSFISPAWAYRSPSVPGVGKTSSGWWAIGEVLRPAPPVAGGTSWLALGTGEYGAQVRGAFQTFYGTAPTVGQNVLVDANHPTGPRWWPDSRLYNALSCEGFTAAPLTFPSYPSSWSEESWMLALQRHAFLGLTLRDEAGDPVTAESIRLHFHPTEPPEGCVAWEESPCEARCLALANPRETREACLELADLKPGSVLASRCEGVCRGEEPPPPEPPPATERECYRWVPTSATLERAAFVPGVPSTGRLEMEVSVSGEWVSAECEGVE